MSRDEMRAKLAELMGWTKPSRFENWRKPVGWIGGEPCHFKDLAGKEHPIPETLDFIAGALPEGWFWHTIRDNPDGHGWHAMAWGPNDNAAETDQYDTEYDARLARVIAAYESERRRA